MTDVWEGLFRVWHDKEHGEKDLEDRIVILEARQEALWARMKAEIENQRLG